MKKIFDWILHGLQYLDREHPHHFILDLDQLDRILEYCFIQSKSHSFPATSIELEYINSSLLYRLEKLVDGLADATTTLEEVVIGMNQSFNMQPATVSIIKRKCVQQQHVPPCEVEEMTKEQQAVVAGYREQQDAKSKSLHSTKGPEVVYSAEQRRTMELMVVVEEE